MLPSRLFRNLGVPPALRSLVTPHASLPATISVQLRLRLGVRPETLLQSGQRLARYSTAASPAVSPPPQDTTSESTTSASQALPETIVPKLRMTFTCTANDCGERSTHEFTRQAYESGIVLVQCPKCLNRHLIADHIGWFKESTEDGKLRTVEDLLRARGEKVTRGMVGNNGDIEYAPE
ncbi:Zf-DNL-domain-containing protein [Favolaschia claudopus]|uniref:Zf-DNL-domain-containing protein n=1 Tax=Favolaschia claudopus TaxID=2862362 RepID=A0AAW0BYC3_9AGAR